MIARSGGNYFTIYSPDAVSLCRCGHFCWSHYHLCCRCQNLHGRSACGICRESTQQ